MNPFRCEELGNGVSVGFFDRSNRYFGDYHRVRVELRIRVLCPGEGVELIKRRSLERMGVPGAEVSSVRDSLAESFWQHASGYLGRPDYPARLCAAEQMTLRRLSFSALPHGY